MIARIPVAKLSGVSKRWLVWSLRMIVSVSAAGSLSVSASLLLHSGSDFVGFGRNICHASFPVEMCLTCTLCSSIRPHLCDAQWVHNSQMLELISTAPFPFSCVYA
eukprot:3865029-Amphidinium_carterae.1